MLRDQVRVIANVAMYLEDVFTGKDVVWGDTCKRSIETLEKSYGGE